MSKRSGGVWCVALNFHTILYHEPVSFGPWFFGSRRAADDFVYHFFAPALVKWARVRLLEWPTGCVDPHDDTHRLALLHDYRMLTQLHDYYRAEKERTGLNYWTWTLDDERPLENDGKQCAARFVAFLGERGEVCDFQ